MKHDLPAVGYVRLPQILNIFPISKSAWWEGCRSGVFPKPVKLGPRSSAWRGAGSRRATHPSEHP
ncbi:MAG: AlpA family phage regulatory protein [Mailhella sp.]|nr:AlpA family phage regulatory protein [Mailhella sp.]